MVTCDALGLACEWVLDHQNQVKTDADIEDHARRPEKYFLQVEPLNCFHCLVVLFLVCGTHASWEQYCVEDVPFVQRTHRWLHDVEPAEGSVEETNCRKQLHRVHLELLVAVNYKE